MFCSGFVYLLLVVASTRALICAQSNFNVGATSYSCTSNLICLGKAHTGGANDSFNGSLSLTQEAPEALSLNQSSIAYYNKAVRMLDPSSRKSTSFNTTFTMNQVMEQYINDFDRDSGDGMAFVISADNSTLGASSSTLGIFNASGVTSFKSIVVEFDIYQNVGPPEYDISDNHVSFDFSNITTSLAADASDVGVRLWWNLTTYAWVEYSSATQSLELRISNYQSRPVHPLLSYTVDLFDLVEEYMWVGFSSGSGGTYSYYYVGNWTFESYGIPTKGHSNLGTIVGVSVAVPAFLVVACALILFFVRKHADGSRAGEDLILQLPDMPKRFSYRQLSVATGGFSEKSKLGKGGFGGVYRGLLPPKGAPIAVKKISGDSDQGEKEFIAEISIISRLRHRNLIQLLGWCKDRQKYLLVYELMPNGSLDKVLFDYPKKKNELTPSWTQRFNIVTGTAAGLEYLHQGWKQQVIHRDIKSSNIMLDGEWNAKLGDFGLARLVDHQRIAPTTMVAGTYGYIAPEAMASGRFTDKTDVFAFGAVLLEIACGRKAFSAHVPPAEIVLVDWVWQNLGEGKLLSMVDSRLEEYDTYWVEVVMLIGLLCSHPNPRARPSMRQVVQMLSGEVPVPSVPATKPEALFSTDPQTVRIEDLHPAGPHYETAPSRSSTSISMLESISSVSNYSKSRTSQRTSADDSSVGNFGTLLEAD